MTAIVIPSPAVSSARWIDAEHRSILAEIDGASLHVPDDPANSDRRAIAQWEAAGNTIASPPAPSAADLIAYAFTAKDKTLATIIIVNVAANGQPAVNVHCDGTPRTRGDLAGMYAWGSANPTASRAWLDESGALLTLTGAEFVTLAEAVGAWADNVYAELGNLIAQINAGTITTTAQIDAATWPTS